MTPRSLRITKALLVVFILVFLFCAAELYPAFSAAPGPGALLQSLLFTYTNLMFLIAGLISLALALICLFLSLDADQPAPPSR